MFDKVKTMSNYLSKASAILTGLSVLALTSFPAFAEEGSVRTTVEPGIKTETSTPAAIKNRRIEEEERIRNQKIKAGEKKIASKTAVLRVKLDKFKDQKKAEVAARVNDNLNTINQKQTAQMQKHLEAMSTILNKLESRVNRATPDVKDPAAAKIAIAAARNAIASASAAVSAQSQKDYTIQVTSESRVRLEAKTTRDKLHQDLTAVRKLAIEAKKSIANAIRIAKAEAALLEKPIKEEGTTSGKQ